MNNLKALSSEGRVLARIVSTEFSMEELDKISGGVSSGSGDNTAKGPVDYTPTGKPESDCD